MMISFLGIVGIIIFGFFIVDTLITRAYLLEKIALGYVLGIGFFTLFLFGFNLLGIPYRLSTSSLILFLLIAISFIVNFYIKSYRKREKSIFYSLKANILLKKLLKMTLLERIFLFLILFLIISSLAADIYWPVKDWDSLTLYDFRGKLFASSGYTNKAFLTVYDLGYPLLTSLAHTWIYLLGPVSPAIIYSLFYIALIIIFYSTLRHTFPRVYSLFFTFILSISPSIFNYSLISYTNLPYTFYISSSFLYLYLWVRNKKTSYLILSSLLLGLSSWTRSNEPFWITAFVIVTIHSLQRKKYNQIIPYFLVVLIVRQSWIFYMSRQVKLLTERDHVLPGLYGLLTQNIGAIMNYGFDLKRILTVFNFVWKNVLIPYALLFSVFIILLIFTKKKFSSDINFFSIIIFFNLLLIYLGTYITSIVYSKWNVVGNSLERISILFIPLLLFCIAHLFIMATSFRKNGAG